MEDRLSFHEDYEVEDDSEEEHQLVSSDEEKDFDKYLLTTKNGKEFLKRIPDLKKSKKILDDVSGTNKDDSDDEETELGTAIPESELLYDQDIDKKNEEWMNKKRNQHKVPNKSGKLQKSDAILSCPACMVTVSVDCQRHDIYKTQFRAMFVMNCVVVHDQLLHYQHQNKSKKRRKKEGPGKLVEYTFEQETSAKTDVGETSMLSESQNDNSSQVMCRPKEVYRPVKCSVCSTEIAVYDENEVYHFFNVIESIA